MTLKSSVVLFQALELLQFCWPHRHLQPHWPLQSQNPFLTKKPLDLDDWIIYGTKMTNTSPSAEASQCYLFEKWLWYPSTYYLFQHFRTIFKPNLTCISFSPLIFKIHSKRHQLSMTFPCVFRFSELRNLNTHGKAIESWCLLCVFSDWILKMRGLYIRQIQFIVSAISIWDTLYQGWYYIWCFYWPPI